MKRVGILGGTGEIGKRIVDNLKNEFNIIASYHYNSKESDSFCIYEKVDVDNETELKEFCKKCDIVINCAGSSYKNGEKVARIVSELNLPYIDPSGEAFLEERLKDIKSKNIFVLSSGFFPGMSGLLMRYICDYFDEPINLEGFSINEEVPSYSAIEDFILTNLSGFGVALSYYDEGKILRNESVITKIVKNKEYKLQNYLTVEIDRIAREYKLKKANWYNNSFGEDIIKKLQEAVIKIKDDNLKEYENVIHDIIKMFKNKVINNRRFSYIKITGKGIKGNCSITKIIEATSEFSSEMSAIIASYTAREIINNKIKNGIYYAMDIVDFEKIMGDITNLKMDLKITNKKERGYSEEYDEEEI